MCLSVRILHLAMTLFGVPDGLPDDEVAGVQRGWSDGEVDGAPGGSPDGKSEGSKDGLSGGEVDGSPDGEGEGALMALERVMLVARETTGLWG